jgi:hypothetical protein
MARQINGDPDFIREVFAGAAAAWVVARIADSYISRLADYLAESTIEAAKRIE